MTKRSTKGKKGNKESGPLSVIRPRETVEQMARDGEEASASASSSSSSEREQDKALAAKIQSRAKRLGDEYNVARQVFTGTDLFKQNSEEFWLFEDPSVKSLMKRFDVEKDFIPVEEIYPDYLFQKQIIWIDGIQLNDVRTCISIMRSTKKGRRAVEYFSFQDMYSQGESLGRRFPVFMSGFSEKVRIISTDMIYEWMVALVLCVRRRAHQMGSDISVAMSLLTNSIALLNSNFGAFQVGWSEHIEVCRTTDEKLNVSMDKAPSMRYQSALALHQEISQMFFTRWLYLVEEFVYSIAKVPVSQITYTGQMMFMTRMELVHVGDALVPELEYAEKQIRPYYSSAKAFKNTFIVMDKWRLTLEKKLEKRSDHVENVVEMVSEEFKKNANP